MNKRPVCVTVISVVYIAAGAIGLAYHFREWRVPHPFQGDIWWISLVRVLAIVAGVFMLRGRNWARWLAIIWIGFHVVLSVFHPVMELVMHAVLFVVFAFLLFRRDASQFFQGYRNAR
jgi:hypothetical protein